MADRPGSLAQLSFERDVRPLFREKDRDAMRKAFDLWSLSDVQAHQGAIVEQVRSGGHALRQPLASGAGSYFGTLDRRRVAVPATRPAMVVPSLCSSGDLLSAPYSNLPSERVSRGRAFRVNYQRCRYADQRRTPSRAAPALMSLVSSTGRPGAVRSDQARTARSGKARPTGRPDRPALP